MMADTPDTARPGQIRPPHKTKEERMAAAERQMAVMGWTPDTAQRGMRLDDDGRLVDIPRVDLLDHIDTLTAERDEQAETIDALGADLHKAWAERDALTTQLSLARSGPVHAELHKVTAELQLARQVASTLSDAIENLLAERDALIDALAACRADRARHEAALLDNSPPPVEGGQ
jgi:hypothetical protein